MESETVIIVVGLRLREYDADLFNYQVHPSRYFKQFPFDIDMHCSEFIDDVNITNLESSLAKCSWGKEIYEDLFKDKSCDFFFTDLQLLYGYRDDVNHELIEWDETSFIENDFVRCLGKVYVDD